MERFSISMEEELLSAFDRALSGRGYRNRSEAIRDLVRNYLVEREWDAAARDVVGVVSLLYNHHVANLTQRLLELQHHATHVLVLCSVHVHLDEEHCLEVIVLKGKPLEVRSLAEELIGTRGVKHGRLVPTTTGQKLP